MKIFKEEPAATGMFSTIFLDYISGKNQLKSFYNVKPELSSFKDLLETRNFPVHKRNILAEVLKEQYADLEINGAVAGNIDLLRSEKTFTVTTGHQLNLATGPLYFIYKIISTVNLAEKLKNAYPDYDFVPVYWMASEDHDFEEINHFSLFGKNYTWETEQSGPVGRFKTDSLTKLLDELPEEIELLKKAYTKGKSLSDATRVLVNDLFGKYGLVCLDADHKEFKKQFSDIFRNEILEGKVGAAAAETSERIESGGYHAQVFVRDINLFLLKNGRCRLERTSVGLNAIDDKQYSEKEIKELLDSSPELFSPNVVLRPLYQECILPNLAYLGGPAEIAYWLQLKDAFQHCDIPFPVLLPRNFFMIVPEKIAAKLEKLGLQPSEFFQNIRDVKDNYLSRQADADFELSTELNELEEVFNKMAIRAEEIDKSLKGFIMAEKQKVLKQGGNIEKRIKKALEQKHEIAIRQIETIKEKLFPGGAPQERTDNIFTFYTNNPEFIDSIKACTDPFDFRFNILVED